MSQGSKVFALAIVALIAIGTYFAYSLHQKREQQRAMAALVGEATTQLRDALAKGATAAQVSKMETAMEALGAMKPVRDRPLAEAAELYLFSARAIVQRSADRARNAEQALRARQALAAHMGGPRGRNDLWIREAVERKNRMERAYFDVDVVLKALEDLLQKLPDSEKPLAARIDSSLLLEASARDAALKQVRAEMARVGDELIQVRGALAAR